jgi:hypothetical protein
MTASRTEYIGMFLVSMATLMLEILLTRIFSVTLYSHLAFVAVSIAMFGMTVGAVIVYVLPWWFIPRRATDNLAISSLFLGLTSAWSIDLHLRSTVDLASVRSPLSQLAAAYAISSVPFVFSGIAIAVLLTQYPRAIRRLYGFDLVGAACGCLLVIKVFDLIGGPRAIFVPAGAAMLAAIAFVMKGMTRANRGPRLRTVLTIAIAAVSTFVFALDPKTRELGYTKGSHGDPVYYEKWNAYSRIAVDFPRLEPPFGWGFSTTYKPATTLRQLRLNIDSSAETVLTAFDGDVTPLEHLQYDVTNIAHHVTRHGSVFIVGAGGGRDILAALRFGQDRIVAVEMNQAIIHAVNDVFGDLTGHLDRNPSVRFVNDEARSYLARTSDRFDLIQISLIDTWAATAAGAFVLSENTLYTVDAWKLLLSRLTDRGILSVSRWFSRVQPVDTYKALALATETLRRSGIDNPRSHLMVVANRAQAGASVQTPRVATLLVKSTPFSEEEIRTLETVANQLLFEVLISPHPASDPAFVSLVDPRRVDQFIAGYRADLRPPTDDRPFFFSMDGELLQHLLLYVSVLTLAFIVLPIFMRTAPLVIARDLPLTIAFVSLGFAFMLIEIAQLQRLIVLLGHPTFTLSVVLFGLLVASGAGSFCSGGTMEMRWSSIATGRLVTLLAVVTVTGFVTPAGVRLFQGFGTPLRIAVALALLMPAGFFMGMAFPIAMRIASDRCPLLMPWFWAINGATSVTASVLAVLISSRWGISVAWYSGLGCYVIAAIAIAASARATDASGAALGNATRAPLESSQILAH